MKTRSLLAGVALLLLGIPTAAVAAPAYTYDGVGGTWADVNKVSVFGPPDSFLCWAAAAADVLEWTGWQGWDPITSSFLDSAAEIYGRIDAGWPDQTGNAVFAYEWWMTNRNQSVTQGNTPFPSQGLNFYPGVIVLTGVGSVTAFQLDPTAVHTQINTYITDHRGIVLSIDVPNSPGQQGVPYSHALTLWGWDDVSHQVYVTDSDDGGAPTLRTLAFHQDGTGKMFIDGYSNLYTPQTDNVLITAVSRLNRNDQNLQPNGSVITEPVPEPASLTLLGLGLISGGYIRRRSRRSK